MFITDRDLLVLEPNLHRDIAWVGQRLTRGTGTVSGNTLTLSGAEIALDSAGVGAGNVVVVAGVPHEVVARVSSTVLTISRPRAEATDTILPPLPASGVECAVVTFAPQMRMVHKQILRMAGIEPEGAQRPGQPTEASITNAAALKRLESLGALHLIYAAAGAPQGPGSPSATRAAMYSDLFSEERRRVAVQIDLNNDGLPEATRRLNVMQFVRA